MKFINLVLKSARRSKRRTALTMISVALAVFLFSALRASGGKLRDQRILFLGAGEAATGLLNTAIGIGGVTGAVVSGAAESDGFNRLVIRAGLRWRDVTILRAVAKYLRQATIQFSQDYMETALSRNPDIARLLVELFHALNDPGDAGRREGRARLAQTRIDKALGDVPSLDDDRIIRRLRNVIANVLRMMVPLVRRRDVAGVATLVVTFVAIGLMRWPMPLVRLYRRLQGISDASMPGFFGFW